jgi:hypothetical protein
MLRKSITGVVFGCVLLLTGSGALADAIGLPSGTFAITVRQGGGIVAQDTVSIGAGGELVDLQPWWVDGDEEDFTQIGTIGPSGSPIILKVTTTGDESFRMLHWYIDVPAGLGDIHSAGPTSLFDPFGGDIDVIISGLSFSNGAAVAPYICDNGSYMVSFMRDIEGHFYESLATLPYNSFGHGVNDIEVPGEEYLDANHRPYFFSVLETGTSASWAWNNIVNPGPSTTVHNGLAGGVTPLSPGYVFELGLSAAFIIIPEPGTLLLLLVGSATMLIRLTRRSR